MIQQQKAGRSLPAEFRHIVSTYGILKPMKGLSATVMRESLYASGYLAVAPMLRGVLQQQPAVANLPGGPLILSGIAAGLLATVCTQPADTIKTRMQASPPCLLRLLGWLARHICLLPGLQAPPWLAHVAACLAPVGGAQPGLLLAEGWHHLR
jgi:hypothetical protein